MIGPNAVAVDESTVVSGPTTFGQENCGPRAFDRVQSRMTLPLNLDILLDPNHLPSLSFHEYDRPRITFSGIPEDKDEIESIIIFCYKSSVNITLIISFYVIRCMQ